MKKTYRIFFVCVLFFMCFASFSVCLSSEPETNASKPNSSGEVQASPKKFIRPKEGFGPVNYGDSIDIVEKFFGRGEIVPEKSDHNGNNLIGLIYKDLGVVFKFYNGQLAMVIIDKKGFCTEQGVQVGSKVGDLVREFGSSYTMDQSILQEAEPEKDQQYEILYKYIAAEVKGSVILKLRIRTDKNFKPKKN